MTEILTFQLAGRHFALPLEQVREVVRAVEITPLSHAPSMVEGVFDLRGRLVPVMDLRMRLGLPAKPVEVSDHLIVASARERLVAVRADAVEWLRTVASENVESAGEWTSEAVSTASGIAKLADGLVLIHDLDRFLSGTEMAALVEAIDASAAQGGEG